jgi:hypothetical protein
VIAIMSIQDHALRHLSPETVLEDPRLSQSDIATRIAGIVALEAPWQRYAHTDGSVWDGYGQIDPAASTDASQKFWKFVDYEHEFWFMGDDYLEHSLHPIDGTPQPQGEEFHRQERPRYQAASQNPLPGISVIALRRAAADAYTNAIERTICAHEWAAPFGQVDDGDIEAILASGIDPEHLVDAGLLDSGTAPPPRVTAAIDIWANPTAKSTRPMADIDHLAF